MNEVQGKALSVFHYIQFKLRPKRALRDPQLAPDHCWHKTQLLQIFQTNMVSNNGDIDKNLYECATEVIFVTAGRWQCKIFATWCKFVHKE